MSLSSFLLSAAMILAAGEAAERPAPNEAVLPAEVRQLLDTAFASEDAAAVASVVRFANQAFPDARAEISALHGKFLAKYKQRKSDEAERKKVELAAASMFQRWDGNIEVGASRVTGSTSNLGLFGALSAHRKGLDWSHRLSARAEVQETNGRRVMERLFAEVHARHDLAERLYGFGLAQFERDPFRGFDGRYSLGLGAGYSLAAGPHLKLDVEGGPSLRREVERDGGEMTTLGARASVDLRWKLSPTLALTQTGSMFVDEEKGSGRAATALDAALLGPLRLRLSYELRYEQDMLNDLSSLDTTSRATFVYDF